MGVLVWPVYVCNRKRVNLIPFGGNGIKGEQGIHTGRVSTERPGEGTKQGLESAVASMLTWQLMNESWLEGRSVGG